MVPILIYFLLTILVNVMIQNHSPPFVDAKVFIVMLEDDPVVTYTASLNDTM